MKKVGRGVKIILKRRKYQKREKISEKGGNAGYTTINYLRSQKEIMIRNVEDIHTLS